MKKRALVSGISGQDGAYLARLLLDKDYEVWGTSRDAESASRGNLTHLSIGENVHIVQLSEWSIDQIGNVLAHCRPHEIYHLAGQSSVGISFAEPLQSWDGIAVHTVNFLEAIRRVDPTIRFFYAGSSECFGDAGVACQESTPFRPKSPYAAAKAAATWAVAAYRASYGIFACTGILFNHESPLRPEGFVTQKIVTSACQIAKGLASRLCLGNVAVRRDWGWAEEYVNCMHRMLQIDQPEDFIIGTGRTESLEYIVERAFGYLNLNWKEFVTVDDSLLRPAEILCSAANPERAEKVLGWKARIDVDGVITRLIDEKWKSGC